MVAKRTTSGFSLMELLVVIGIFVVLMAIIVPVGKRLREGNRTSTCEVHLAQIGQAMRAYYMDEHGAPPVGVLDADGDGSPDNLVVDATTWPQLQVLWRLDYLRSRDILHCPRHLLDSTGAAMRPSSPEYYTSYMGRDEKAKPLNSIREFRYLPYRFATATDFPDDYRRQLCQGAALVDMGGTTYRVAGPMESMPPDDTVITWCDRHAETHKVGGHGQYLVLYWDGSVELVDEELCREAGTLPAERDEAWLVKPSDMAQ